MWEGGPVWGAGSKGGVSSMSIRAGVKGVSMAGVKGVSMAGVKGVSMAGVKGVSMAGGTGVSLSGQRRSGELSILDMGIFYAY